MRDKPTELLPDAIPFGDTSRPSASLMFAPVRSRAKVIGILSIHSYTLRAYTQGDLDTLLVLADYCGGALERVRAEQALRESEQRFRGLFEGSPEAIFVEDLAGNVLDANPAACRLHGLMHDQLVGKNVRDLVPPQRRDEVAATFQRVAAEELNRVKGESWEQLWKERPDLRVIFTSGYSADVVGNWSLDILTRKIRAAKRSD